MKNIISASRRTDIPAFYAQWMLNRLKSGSVLYANPYSGTIHQVSLKPEDVTAIVFWTKNPEKLEPYLGEIDTMRYRYYFQFTITGHPGKLEPRVVDTEKAIDCFKRLSKRLSPEHLQWRFDPILLTPERGREKHLETFSHIAAELEGFTRRCYISFTKFYGKVKKNLARHGINALEPDSGEKIDFSQKLAEIGHGHGISLYSCCDESIVCGMVKKGHCIDAEIIKNICSNGFREKINPTRPGCGCQDSRDIGAYDTCRHGCVYCYASSDPEASPLRQEASGESRRARFPRLPSASPRGEL